MNLDKRISQIEQRQNSKSISLRIARFIVAPEAEILGYECEGLTVLREPDESIETLNSRSIDAVSWPSYTTSKIFYPLSR